MSIILAGRKQHGVLNEDDDYHVRSEDEDDDDNASAHTHEL